MTTLKRLLIDAQSRGANEVWIRVADLKAIEAEQTSPAPTGDAKAYADLYALNQAQADKIETLEKERAEMRAFTDKQREEIRALEALVETHNANASMGDDVVGDAPQS